MIFSPRVCSFASISCLLCRSWRPPTKTLSRRSMQPPAEGGREEALARDVLGGRNCRITGKETKGRNAGERVRVVRENGFVIGMERGECARLYVGMHLPFACRNAHAHTLQHTYVHVHARIHTHGRARAPYYMR